MANYKNETRKHNLKALANGKHWALQQVLESDTYTCIIIEKLFSSTIIFNYEFEKKFDINKVNFFKDSFSLYKFLSQYSNFTWYGQTRYKNNILTRFVIRQLLSNGYAFTFDYHLNYEYLTSHSMQVMFNKRKGAEQLRFLLKLQYNSTVKTVIKKSFFVWLFEKFGIIK